MPIYRYKCPTCQKEFEQLLPLEDMDKPIGCSECGAILKRLMSVTTFRMKQTSRGMVEDTLNREHEILPPKQVEIMDGGLNTPPRPVIGTGFGG